MEHFIYLEAVPYLKQHEKEEELEYLNKRRRNIGSHSRSMAFPTDSIDTACNKRYLRLMNIRYYVPPRKK